MRVGMWILALALVLPEVARTAAPPRPGTAPGVREARRPGEAIAVVIGKGHYRDPAIPAATWAEADAASVRDAAVRLLGYRPEDVLGLSDATLADLNKVFGNAASPAGKLHRWLTPGRTDVLVYYSGHGARDPRGGGAFLVPSDADLDYLEVSAYPLEQLWDNLGRLPVRSLTVVLDACFSGPSPGGSLVPNASPVVLRRKAVWSAPEGAVLMAAAAEDQVSSWYPEKRHGLFTYLWLEGIAGGADENRDGAVTLGELKTYLAESVPYYARRLFGREQHPVVLGPAEAVVARAAPGPRSRERARLPSLPALGEATRASLPAPDRKSAEKGEAEAQFLLASAYAEGRGVPRDGETAARWYARAAEQGHPRAQNNLGVAYDHGRGVPQDYVKAYMWFNLAASRLSGVEGEQAARNRSLVGRKMTAEQIAEAQRLARAWTEAHRR